MSGIAFRRWAGRIRCVAWLLAAVCIAGSLRGTPCHAAEAEQTAWLHVPADALVFAGPGLRAPDAEGHFAIGIRLPLPSLHASRCDTPYLIVGLGTLNKPLWQLTNADRQVIARNDAYYATLQAAARRAAAQHRGSVAIPVRNDPAYLRVVNDVIEAPYCMLSIDGAKVP